MLTTDQQIETLIERNDELENYFRSTIIPQLFIDSDLILQKYTPPAMTQFRLTAGDIGKSILDITDNFRFPTLVGDIQYVINNNQIIEKEVQTTDLRWYQMDIIPYVVQKNNRTNGVIITFVEITNRIKDLKEREKLISDHETLLDTISHDIKAPLNTFVRAIDLFKNVSLDDQKEFHSVLQMVETSLKKMQNMINELTDTRKKEHKYKAEEELINFRHILEDVRLTLNDVILESGAILKSEIGVSEMIFSKRKLRSILYNLVNNALKFKSPDRRPEILITTTREKGFIVISVKDNGIGIEANKQEAVFSKYFRVENAIEGSGIGLYLIRSIVTNSGGQILLESQPGKGSEFKVYIKAE